MRILFYAQSAFHITSDDGTRILIDPFEKTERIRYEPDFDEADIVLVTHGHGDHSNVGAVPGDFEEVRGDGAHSVKGYDFLGIPSYHDQQEGAQRGPNTIFVFDVDGIRIAHLGDQGCELEPDQEAQLDGVNVMLAPIGGGPTLDPDLIWALAERVQPNVFIPCHFKTPEIDLPLITVDEFVQGKPNVRHAGSSDVTLDRDSLPEPVEILVLERCR